MKILEALYYTLQNIPIYYTFQHRPDLRPIYTSIEETQGYCPSNSECVERLLDGELDGVFLEAPTADYLTSQRCNLKMMDSIQERNYGIALPKGRLYKVAIIADPAVRGSS